MSAENKFQIDLACLSDSGLKTLATKHNIKWNKGDTRSHVVQLLRESGVGRPSLPSAQDAGEAQSKEDSSPIKNCESNDLTSILAAVTELQQQVRIMSKVLKELGTSLPEHVSEQTANAIGAIADACDVNKRGIDTIADLAREVGEVRREQLEQTSRISDLTGTVQIQNQNLLTVQPQLPAIGMTEPSIDANKAPARARDSHPTGRPLTYASATVRGPLVPRSSTAASRMLKESPDPYKYHLIAEKQTEKKRQSATTHVPCKDNVKCAPRIKRAKFFTANFELDCTAADIIEFCRGKDVVATGCYVYPSKMRYGTLCAILTVDHKHSDTVMSDGFWPEGIYIRPFIYSEDQTTTSKSS